MNKIIEFKDLSIKYPGANENVLEHINLEINKGDMVAIIGPSGVGKSTLFKVLVKNLKPVGGEAILNSKKIYSYNNKEWKEEMNKIGFLSQQPNLISSDNVYNNIVRSISQYKNWIYRVFSVLTKEQKIKIFENLDELNILDKAFYRVSELSGGQQQRVEIAKLLAKNVELILADEPTSNLDHETSKEVLEILKNLNQNSNITVLVNIHDLSLVKNYFNRVIAIRDKKIVMDKKTKDVEEWQLAEILKK